jgi:hypothetical protein
MYSAQDWFGGAKNLWYSDSSQYAGALPRVVAMKLETRYEKGFTWAIVSKDEKEECKMTYAIHEDPESRQSVRAC